MAAVVYLLGALTSLLCAVLLFRAFIRGRAGLLLWSATCFLGLAASNVLVFVDLVIFPIEPDLYVGRLSTAAVSMVILVLGLVLESE